jgi:hypothetical protein
MAAAAVELYKREFGALWAGTEAAAGLSETHRLLQLRHSRGGKTFGASSSSSVAPLTLYRFTHLAFDAAGRRLSASDQRGDVRIFDFDANECVAGKDERGKKTGRLNSLDRYQRAYDLRRHMREIL